MPKMQERRAKDSKRRLHPPSERAVHPDLLSAVIHSGRRDDDYLAFYGAKFHAL
jgi:hypothetical protein